MANFRTSYFGCDRRTRRVLRVQLRLLNAENRGIRLLLRTRQSRLCQHGLYYFASAAVVVDSSGGAENARLENAGLGLSGTGKVWNATCGIT